MSNLTTYNEGYSKGYDAGIVAGRREMASQLAIFKAELSKKIWEMKYVCRFCSSYKDKGHASNCIVKDMEL